MDDHTRFVPRRVINCGLQLKLPEKGRVREEEIPLETRLTTLSAWLPLQQKIPSEPLN